MNGNLIATFYSVSGEKQTGGVGIELVDLKAASSVASLSAFIGANPS